MLKRVIVRHNDEDAGLIAGTPGVVNTESPVGLVRFVPLYPPVTPRWARMDMFLLLEHFLRKDRKLDRFWTLCSHRRQMDGVPMFVSHPHEDIPSKIYGNRPYAFESEGEAAYWSRTKGFSLNEFIIGMNIPCRTKQ